MIINERQKNQTAYRRLLTWINQTYPSGWFVAIAGGEVVADAERFEEIRSQLLTLGHDPTKALVVQAGVEYPETAIIFVEGRSS